MARRRLLLVAALAVLWARPSLGATVAVVRPAHPSSAVNETLVRIYGELLSLGFAVEMANPPAALVAASGDWHAWLDDWAGSHGAEAVVAIAANPLAVTVWIADEKSGRLVPSRVDVDPHAVNASEQLAIHAIEVLRSSFLEMNLAARPRQAVVATVAPVVASPSGARFGLELGGLAMLTLDGVGPAVLPTARFDWEARSWLVLQAVVAGLGTHASVASDAGDASVAQSYALVGTRFRSRAEQRLRPLVGLAMGVLRSSLEGHGHAPDVSRVVSQWAFLVEGSAGVELALGRRYSLLGTLHAQVAAPYVSIHFGDDVVASAGRPNLIASLALGAQL